MGMVLGMVYGIGFMTFNCFWGEACRSIDSIDHSVADFKPRNARYEGASQWRGRLDFFFYLRMDSISTQDMIT